MDIAEMKNKNKIRKRKKVYIALKQDRLNLGRRKIFFCSAIFSIFADGCFIACTLKPV
jgi:CRISPR/Cas system CMR-associated protein Cmr3 (group 5 of RAMP superfamily)